MDIEKITKLIHEFSKAKLTSFTYEEGNLRIEIKRDEDGNTKVSQQEGEDHEYYLFNNHERIDGENIPVGLNVDYFNEEYDLEDYYSEEESDYVYLDDLDGVGN